ncbi:MAG: hypothetical protein ACTSQ0_06800 [Candidatus Heimdallarchaeota archaeon]
MKGVYTRVGLSVFYITLVVSGLIFIMPFNETIAENDNTSPPELVIDYTTYLGVEYFEARWTDESFSNNYGFQYSFSTSPSTTIKVVAMAYSDLTDWGNNVPVTDYPLDTGSSGSGTWRFPYTAVWAIAFWNIGHTGTTLTYSVGVVDLGAPAPPPPPPTNNPSTPSGFPWGWIITPIVVVTIIIGTIIFAVRSAKQRKEQPTFIQTRPTFQSSSPFQQQSTYRLQTSLQQITNNAVLEMSRGNVNGAISYWNQALQINSNYYPAIVGLGLIYYSVKDYNRAISYLSHAARIAPITPEINQMLTNARMYSNQPINSFTTPGFQAQPTTIESKETIVDSKSNDTTDTVDIGDTVCEECGASIMSADEFCPFCGWKSD